ncbi:hypothetical protein ECFRIK1985_0332 [Escherichia coli FRIK1985]|nr:hypothetical protein ECFRIK1985_0332 [Escherichia coli FRIK1985]EKK78517.1 hypothetical protein EC100869_0242 [Escherichia coli 10.0869]
MHKNLIFEHGRYLFLTPFFLFSPVQQKMRPTENCFEFKCNRFVVIVT